MKYRIILLLFLIGTVIACQQQKKNYILTDEQLANLMLDLQLSETMMVSLSAPQQDSLKELFWGKLTSVYQVSEQEIRDQVAQLESDPEKLKAIMDQIKFRSDSIN